MEAEEVNSLTPPPLNVFSGDTEEWDSYQESLFEIFRTTILEAGLTFQGVKIQCRRQPEYQGKHAAFWHLISEGEREDQRTPDFRRCERLAWVAWIIQNADKKEISYWESKRGRETNIVLWNEQSEFAVILGKRNGYYLLLTAYAVIEEHRIASFQREREEYLKSSTQKS